MILDILLMLVVLGLVVLVHEMGHFVAARMNGIRVETFSIGFGKKLITRKRKGTDFSLSLIPLGGYVKLAGETEFDNQDPAPDHFLAKKRWQRFLVFFMGPLMNVLLAFLILAVTFMTGREVSKYQTEPPRIGYVMEDSAARRAGIRQGDLILSLGNREIGSWRDLEMAVGANPNLPLKVRYRRGNRVMTGTLTPDEEEKTGIGQAGWLWEAFPQIVALQPGYPAADSGLAPGDLILAVNGEPVHPIELSDLIQRAAPGPITLKVRRKGEIQSITLSPRKTGEGYKIGVQTRFYFQTITKRYGVFKAFGKAVVEMGELIGATYDAIKKMLLGKLSPKTLSGPIAIARYSRQTLISGFGNFLTFIAFISLQLGIINLLPIPVLDGGHLMILALEGLFRRDFNPRVKNFLMYLGLAFLLTLMGFVILNDIARELPNGWDSLLPF